MTGPSEMFWEGSKLLANLEATTESFCYNNLMMVFSHWLKSHFSIFPVSVKCHFSLTNHLKLKKTTVWPTNRGLLGAPWKRGHARFLLTILRVGTGPYGSIITFNKEFMWLVGYRSLWQKGQIYLTFCHVLTQNKKNKKFRYSSGSRDLYHAYCKGNFQHWWIHFLKIMVGPT